MAENSVFQPYFFNKMKKIIFLLLLPFVSLAQSTTITAGTTANVSLPKLSYTQIMAIPSPQAGMEAFDTDYGCVRIYNGNAWRCHDTPQNQPNVLTTAVKADNSNTVQQTYNDNLMNGSVIVAGNFYGSLTFGSTTLTSAGASDIFLVRYDVNGNVIWANRIGGTGNGTTLFGDDFVTDVAVETGTNNFYITGRIGSVSLTGAMTGAATNGTDGFIAKFDMNGNLLWSSFFSGTSANAYDGINAMSVLGSDIYVCGYQAGGASLGAVNLGTSNSNFIAKYNSSGTAQWAYELPGATMVEITCNSARVAVTGTFTTSVNLGGITYTSTGFSDIFVVCLDNLGNFQWGNTFGTTNNDYAKAVSFRHNKTVLTGTFNGALSWGNTIISSIGGDDIFLSQYDISGNKEWIRTISGSNSEAVWGMKPDALGNIYLIGGGINRIWFGNQVISNMGQNVFVAKIDPSGDCIWAKSFNGGNTYATGLSNVLVNGFIRLYITGFFQGNNVQFGHTKLTSGNSNMFFATLTEN